MRAIFDISDEKYSSLRRDLDVLYSSYCDKMQTDWREFKQKLNDFSETRLNEDLIQNRYSSLFGDGDPVSLEGCRAFIQGYIRKKIDLPPGSELVISDDDFHNSRWGAYRKYLKEKKGFSKETIAVIRETAEYALLLHGQPNNIDQNEIVKGLAVGNVQSGKTANYAGVMSVAADNGFNVIVVLSGVMTNLREQTENRLKQELTDIDKACPEDLGTDQAWQFVSGAELADPARVEIQIAINIPKVAVILKNATRLRYFKRWLDQLVVNSQTPIKMLVIDDECDQAGLDMNAYRDDADATAVHSGILDILYHDPSMPPLRRPTQQAYAPNSQSRVAHTTYIGYTATPYASVLHQGPFDADGNVKRNLYPKDFILSLLQPKSSPYWSPSVFFGEEAGDPINPCVNTFDALEWSRVQYWLEQRVPDELRDQLPEGVTEEELMQAPKSFKEAVAWFVASLAVLRSKGTPRVVSMLIHNSHLINNSELLGRRLNELYPTLTTDDIRLVYEQQRQRVTREVFSAHWREYNLPDDADLPSWAQIQRHVKTILDLGLRACNNDISARYEPTSGLTLAIDTCRSKNIFEDREKDSMRLRYPSPDEQNALTEAQGFVVIGGNTLSRGLTIEGLVSTWFARPVGTGDTLMQMGRWFGYRMGYELLPRLWLSESTTKEFQYLSQMETSLHESIDENMLFSFRNASSIGPMIRFHPSSSMMPTARNRMRGATRSLTWLSQSPQTLYFDTALETLNHNWSTLEGFIQTLSQREYEGPNQTWPSKHNIVWHDVPLGLIDQEFFGQLKLSEKESPKSLTHSAIESIKSWMNRLVDDSEVKTAMESWTIALISNDPSSPNIQSCDLGGFQVGLHTRRAVGYNGEPLEKGRLYIKALRSPIDLFADDANGELDRDSIERDQQVSPSLELRKSLYQNDRVPPMLLIYPLNGKVEGRSEERIGYDLGQNLVGLSIIFPSINTTLDENMYTVKLRA